MKNLFFEHFGFNNDTKNEIWKNCIFTFDTNVLLDMYNYSEKTKDKFFYIFRQIEDRIWLTNRVVNEFFNNRLNRIKKMINDEYELIINNLDNVVKQIEDMKKYEYHHVIDEDSFCSYKEYKDIIKENLQDQKNKYDKRIYNDDDDVLQELGKIFYNKVGKGYDEKKIKELFEEGKGRFENFIPPGFMDKDKNKGKVDKNKKESDYTYKEKLRIYGDFIIWKEIISQSINSACPIIFITNEEKEDWWLNEQGKTIQPRPELIKEFYEHTNNYFYMYKSHQFLNIYEQKYSSSSLDEDIYNEVQNTSKHFSLFRNYTFHDHHYIDNNALNYKNEPITLKKLKSLKQNLNKSSDLKDILYKTTLDNIDINKLTFSSISLLLFIKYNSPIDKDKLDNLMKEKTPNSFYQNDRQLVLLLDENLIDVDEDSHIVITDLGKQLIDIVEDIYDL